MNKIFTKKTKEIIEQLLIKHPRLRDDKDSLTINVILQMCKDTKSQTELEKIKNLLKELKAYGFIVQFRNIDRAMRKIQELNEELKGKSREKQEKSVKEELKNFQTNVKGELGL